MAPVLQSLAQRYLASKRGRTGAAARDFIVDYRELLSLGGTADGDARAKAETDLAEAAAFSGGKLILDRMPRDPTIITRVRLLAEGGEAWLFDLLGQPSPSEQRATLVATFESAAADLGNLPERWHGPWEHWCRQLAESAAEGRTIAPFSKTDVLANAEMLRVLKAVLAWPDESLLRVASCVICGDSKQLEKLAPRLGQALSQLTAGRITRLDELGLVEAPRTILLQGPLQIHTPRGTVDLGILSRPSRISASDIETALDLSTTATRCLSVENETTFHALARLDTGILLIHTSYPGSGVLQLYQRLPASLEFWHFGDTDPAGFDILRDLRSRSGRCIKALHMNFRDNEDSPQLSPQEKRLLERLIHSPQLADLQVELRAMLAAGRKGRFEQENWGRPSSEWPFYTTGNSGPESLRE